MQIHSRCLKEFIVNKHHRLLLLTVQLPLLLFVAYPIRPCQEQNLLSKGELGLNSLLEEDNPKGIIIVDSPEGIIMDSLMAIMGSPMLE